MFKNSLFNATNEFLNSQKSYGANGIPMWYDGQIMQKKEEERRIAEEQAAKDRYWKIPICYDDDDDYTIAITPVLPTKEPVNSQSMGDEHFDTIPATESDEVIKSSVENLVPILSDPRYFLVIPTVWCDVPLCNNPTPLKAFKEQFGLSSISKQMLLCCDADAYENSDMFDASPPMPEIVPAMVLVVAVPLPVPDFSLSIMKPSMTTIKEKVVHTTTHADFSQYDSFIFDLSINLFPPADRSDFHHEEFADELAHILSPPEYDHFCFKIEPELGNLTMDVIEDIFPTREPRVHVPNDCPDSEASRARGFVLRSQELQILSFILGIQYPNLID
ncbi:hypothetical protein Tco_1530857 [Tanacetum coccineum]